MPNLNPAQKLKNEVLQNWGGFKFFLLFFFSFLFFCFDFLSACRTQSARGVLSGAPLDPIRSQLLEPVLINIQVQGPNKLLLQVRDRLMYNLIPVWLGIQLRASYFRLAQFPALPPGLEMITGGE